MSFHGREAVSIENDQIRVTVLREGGHLAELLLKGRNVNPLWIPPWPSGEPSTYNTKQHAEFGNNSESKLLLGIMGHNLCLGMFGPPSEAEAAAGLTVHGEASVVPYDIVEEGGRLTTSATLPLTGLMFKRVIEPDGNSVVFQEAVTNLSALDRPIAWTQHVTLGPPFIDSGTRFSFPAAQSRTFEDIGFDGGVMKPAADFVWPDMPLSLGGTVDLRVFQAQEPFSRFTTHLMKPQPEVGFAAFSPQQNVLIGYRWRRQDFPWLGFWQENKKRCQPPWNNKSVTCGLEFGVSPFPETRREMVGRGSLFGTPAYRWLPALATAQVTYTAFIRSATHIDEASWR